MGIHVDVDQVKTRNYVKSVILITYFVLPRDRRVVADAWD